MELDDVAKGAVAAVLTDQVETKTGFAYKVAGAVSVVALVGAFLIDGWLRWLIILVLLAGLAGLGFLFVSKRLALRLINRLAPPADLSSIRHKIDGAIAEANLPTGPVGFLKMIWRLRKGVGPEIERLGSVIARFKSDLG